MIGTSGAVTLAPTAGEITQSIKLYNSANSKITVELSQDTKATTPDGQVFSGTIAAPKVVASDDVSKTISGGGSSNKVLAAITVDVPGQSVLFDKPAKVSIPIEIDGTENIEDLKVFYYDKKENKYKLAGDGGQLSADGKSFDVEVSHFTLFAVIDSKESEITLQNSDAVIYKAVAEQTQIHGSADANFADVDSSEWFAPFVAELANKSVIVGYPDGSFRPQNSLNRAEIVKIAVAAFDFTVPVIDRDPFADVPHDAWFAPFVATAKAVGIIDANSANFRPGDPVNRAEALKILTLASRAQLSQEIATAQFSDVADDAWFVPFVNFAAREQIISGYSDGTFRPGDPVNRAEAAKMVSLLLQLKSQKIAFVAPEVAPKLSFWQKISPANLFSSLFGLR
jgi:hypothetical protein